MVMAANQQTMHDTVSEGNEAAGTSKISTTPFSDRCVEQQGKEDTAPKA